MHKGTWVAGLRRKHHTGFPMLQHLTRLFLLLFTVPAQAQATDMARLAKCLEGDVKARLNGHMELVLDRSEEGVRTQQIVIPIRLLDPFAIDTTADGGMLKIGCNSEHPRCLSRELFHQNTRWRSSELWLPLAPGAAGVATDLIRTLLPDETAQCR